MNNDTTNNNIDTNDIYIYICDTTQLYIYIYIVSSKVASRRFVEPLTSKENKHISTRQTNTQERPH